MNINQIISKKRDKGELCKEEIDFFVKSAVDGSVPNYQLSPLLMAIYINGMTENEIFNLTESMSKSGEVMDLEFLGDKTVDKHSTGGVGDKTTLICGPIAASIGCTVAKMSGRGLGHTGGTIDKLESINGFRTDLSKEEFFNISKKIGICLMGHTENFVPADSIIYSLRDVTSTVESIPLIASSIMSKKLASGAKNILLDIKFGSGAFMKNIKDAESLAKTMVKIGNKYNRNTMAVITDMEIPLGKAIGNNLEIKEAIEVLKGKGDKRLTELCIVLAANMYSLCYKEDFEIGYRKAKGAIEDGSALNKLYEIVENQGGDIKLITGEKAFPIPKNNMELFAQKDGYVTKTDSLLIGNAACQAGAGRNFLGEKIDFCAGVLLNKTYGEKVKKGELIATIYGEKDKLSAAFSLLEKAINIGKYPPKKTKLIYKTIKGD